MKKLRVNEMKRLPQRHTEVGLELRCKIFLPHQGASPRSWSVQAKSGNTKHSTDSSEITWPRSYLSGFPTMKCPFSPISSLYSLGGSHYAETGLKDQGVLLLALRVECLHKLFGILHGRFIFCSAFIHLFSYLFF